MYAETGLMFPCFQNLSQEIQPLEGFCKSLESNNVSLSNLFQTSTIAEYDLGGEGDLFKAPEPIIGEPILGLDPATAAISMMSCCEDVISSQGMKIADISSLESEPLFSEVFYECRKDLLEKAAIEPQLAGVLDVTIPPVKIDENQAQVNGTHLGGTFQRSGSSGCLNSMEGMNGTAMKPSFVDFSGANFGATYGIRRAFSEGDIKNLGNDNMNFVSSFERPAVYSNCTSEERREKLSRYRNKKTKRNFGRKIKYACRKALADSQPRIRGRFAKTEELDILKRH